MIVRLNFYPQGDSKMTIDEIQERLPGAESTMALMFATKTARAKARLAHTRKCISIPRVIYVMTIRKLAYLTLPNRT